MARATDGEAFAILINNPALPTEVQLDLRLIEADQVTTPDLNQLTSSAVDGILFDTSGNPIEYHVLRKHPGDSSNSLTRDYDRVPASAVVHWFRSDRPGQSRGIPDIMPALPLFAQLRRFTLAVLAAAETAADFAGILYTDAPANGEADAAEPFEPIELEKRALVTMPGGWKMSQMQAEQPATTYAEFKHEILNEIARCLNMPFNVAAANSSGYNYASGRLDHQTYFKAIRVEQSHLECVVLDRILTAWFDEAALLADFLPAGLGPIADWPHQWFWDGHEHVDPAKEASAQATRLSNLTTTLADEYAKRGLDWETQLRQRAKEMQLMNELGLTMSQSQAPAPTETPNETDQATPASDG
jgi:capsid protein